MTPGVPGDSGSAFVSADGKAIGILSTLGLAPLPLSNNIGDLAKELAFAQQHSGISGPAAGQRHRAVLAHPLTASDRRPATCLRSRRDDGPVQLDGAVSLSAIRVAVRVRR